MLPQFIPALLLKAFFKRSIIHLILEFHSYSHFYFHSFSYAMKAEGRDDNAIVPDETQKKIVNFFKENLFPAVEAHILSKYPIFFGYPNRIENVHHFFQLWELWEEIFTPEQQIQLYKMKIILYLPNRAYMVTHLKALLGASMDIIKDFGKPEWKDLLEQSFSDYFKYCISNFKYSQIELFLF